MEILTEDLHRYVPHYLSGERRNELISELRNPSGRKYYFSQKDPEPLQGDGWERLQLFRFENGERSHIHGLVLTNSCDLAAANTRMLPAKLNFVPLLELAKYLSLLESNGVAKQRLEQHARDIRSQQISEIFYLPQDPGYGPERIAYLRDIHTMPVAALAADSESSRLFSLSDVGFYIFVIKLSIHFCRLHEAVARSDTP